MTEKLRIQNAIAKYTELFWEMHFGEKPQQITVTFRPPFLLIHLSGFLLPAERLFLSQGRENKVLETRDLLIDSLKPDLLIGLQEHSAWELQNLYADWDLANESGLLIATMDKREDLEEFPWPESVDEETLQEIIMLNSMRTQKKPDETRIYWLNDHLLLVERVGIMVEIEKQLIKNGIIEELRLAKRPLEHQIVKLFNLEETLKSRVRELYVDWNFKEDFSYMVLLLEPR